MPNNGPTKWAQQGKEGTTTEPYGDKEEVICITCGNGKFRPVAKCKLCKGTGKIMVRP